MTEAELDALAEEILPKLPAAIKEKLLVHGLQHAVRRTVRHQDWLKPADVLAQMRAGRWVAGRCVSQNIWEYAAALLGVPYLEAKRRAQENIYVRLTIEVAWSNYLKHEPFTRGKTRWS